MSEPGLELALRTADFDYHLPPGLIAQTPVEPRDSARLLLVRRTDDVLGHYHVADLDRLLSPGDLLVANRTRVLPARLRGRKVAGGGQVEALLLRQTAPDSWEALVRPGRRLAPGVRVCFEAPGRGVEVIVGARLANGGRQLELLPPATSSDLLGVGEVPLPPYIKSWVGDPERYQTVYGDLVGSAAAPTAGLHFTPDLLERLRQRGVGLRFVTLHVGADTFRPLRHDDLAEHEMHAEWAEVPAETLAAIAATRARGGRAVIVGTTTVRALESAALHGGADGWRGWTRLFITPGYRFRYVDALLTNFHLPRSTLLVLVSALAGRQRILAAYQQAVARGYRFYSFGDAMLIE